MGKTEELKAKLEAHEAEEERKRAEAEKERAEAAEIFDIDEFVTDAELVREAYVKKLDRKVKYKKLTVAENAEVARIRDTEQRGQKMLFLMLSKADPSITEDKVSRIGSDVAAVILASIIEQQTFLEESTPGS